MPFPCNGRGCNGRFCSKAAQTGLKIVPRTLGDHCRRRNGVWVEYGPVAEAVGWHGDGRRRRLGRPWRVMGTFVFPVRDGRQFAQMRDGGSIEIRAIDALGQAAQVNTLIDQSPVSHLAEEPQSVGAPWVGRTPKENAASLGRRPPGKAGEDSVRVDVQIFAPRQEGSGVGRVLGAVAKFRAARSRARIAPARASGLSSAQRARTTRAFSGAFCQMSREVAIVAPTPARRATSPQGAPAQNPAICPEVSVSTVRAGGTTASLTSRPATTPAVASQ